MADGAMDLSMVQQVASGAKNQDDTPLMNTSAKEKFADGDNELKQYLTNAKPQGPFGAKGHRGSN
jgi:hypothetical protein